MDLKRATLVVLIDHSSTPIRNKRLSPTSKAKREASRNKFVKKSRVPDRVVSLEEVDCSKNRPRARLGFVKPIRNGLKIIKNLIESRPSRADTGLTGRKNAVRIQKEE